MQSKRPDYRKHDRDKDTGMVISTDSRSMQRGRRRVPRTEVCRPSLVWLPEGPDDKLEGVVLDLNPRGMRLRMLEEFSEGTVLTVQLMRDDEFMVPLSQPLSVVVVRVESSPDGFYDHGTILQVAKIKKPGTVRPIRLTRPNTRSNTIHRMFTSGNRNDKRGR